MLKAKAIESVKQGLITCEYFMKHRFFVHSHEYEWYQLIPSQR